MPHRSRRAGAVSAALLTLVLMLAATGCGKATETHRGAAHDDGDGTATVPMPRARTFDLEVIARGLVRPTHVSGAPGDARGLWVLEQPGRVLRLGAGRRTTVLDLRREVSLGAERGLLGLAFHPGFATNGRFVVDYTDRRGDTRVVEFRAGPDRRARRTEGRLLLHVRQPEENHNGGALAFAPDGRLLVGMGDGGGAFDPRDRAQDPRTRLGKVLAADVDAAGAPVWHTLLSGVRNPWRMWIDHGLNELWLGDVGQDQVEEIDRVRYEPDEPPRNLGWPAFEGERALPGRRLDASGELVAPVASYSHKLGCSVTGGLIYRGRAIPALAERYVYGDFCTGNLWSLRPLPGLRVGDLRREVTRAPMLTHLGADADGELVMATGAGEVLRAVSARPAP